MFSTIQCLVLLFFLVLGLSETHQKLPQVLTPYEDFRFVQGAEKYEIECTQKITKEQDLINFFKTFNCDVSFGNHKTFFLSCANTLTSSQLATINTELQKRSCEITTQKRCLNNDCDFPTCKRPRIEEDDWGCCTEIICELLDLIPEKPKTNNNNFLLTNSSHHFLQIGNINNPQIYIAARDALESYRQLLVGQALPLQYNYNPPLLVQIQGNNFQLLGNGLVLKQDANPMKIWNFFSFYGSHRHIGQWFPNNNLCNHELILFQCRFDNGVNPIANAWISGENSYVTLAQYNPGKPYPALKGEVVGTHNRAFTDPIHFYGYHLYDQAVIANNANPFLGLQITPLMNAYLAQPYQPQEAARVDLVNQQIQDRLTPQAFAACYRLHYDPANVLTTCNVRVLELFLAISMETHRDSYTAVINAAMIDLFRANVQYYSTANFYDFFGQTGNNQRKHNLAFSDATGKIHAEGGNLNAEIFAWYQSRADGTTQQHLVYLRERQITGDWIALLHNYECFLVLNGYVDNIALGGGNFGVTYNNLPPAGKTAVQNRLYFGGICPNPNPLVLNIPRRKEFVMYAAYRAALKLNNWNDNTYVNQIEATIAPLWNNGGNQLYTAITRCIYPPPPPPVTCQSVNANQNQFEVCQDIFCTLLEYNSMVYI